MYASLNLAREPEYGIDILDSGTEEYPQLRIEFSEKEKIGNEPWAYLRTTGHVSISLDPTQAAILAARLETFLAGKAAEENEPITANENLIDGPLLTGEWIPEDGSE